MTKISKWMRVLKWLLASGSAACLLGPLGFQSARAVEPTQQPLITRVGEVPKPSVMITLDDSGSMLSDHMPEGNVTMYGKAIRLDINDEYIIGFPNDPYPTNSGKPYARAFKNSNELLDDLYQKQYRSPDINSLYYNPDIRYDPWINPVAAGGRWVNSTPTAAKWRPKNTTTLNLTATISNCCNATNTTNPVTWQETLVAGGTVAGSRNTTKKNFSPGIFYRLVGVAGVKDPTNTNHFKRYDVNVDGEHAPSTKAPTRTDCAGTRCTKTEELQNFANWFTYYRTRESMAKAALSEALPNFVGKMRVGWGRINKASATIDGRATTVVARAIRDMDTAYMNTVLGEIQGIASSGGTPLRVALDSVGKYFTERNSSGSPQSGNPWLNTVGTANSGALACRRAVNLLTTDGYDTQAYTDDTRADWDSTDFGNTYRYTGSTNNPNNYSPDKYTPVRPFRDGATGTVYNNTLADVAMKYYIRDLDSLIPNKIAPNEGDIAFWQHVTQFTMGIGVAGSLDSSTAASKKATLAGLTSGAIANWPNRDTNDPNKIDDMWHAAVNSGGDFYSVKNVTEMTNALFDAFGKAVGNVSREAGVATVATTLSASNIKFVPEYKSVDWYGDVKAYQLDSYGSVPNGSAPKWSAVNALPAAADRKLFTMDGSTPVEFKWATIGSTNQGLMSQDVLNYVRGDQSKEGTDTGEFRKRFGKLLGDFINSPPVLVKDLVDSTYELLSDSTQASTYRAFVMAKGSRSNSTLFVGGNAGILHGFRVSDGQEIFGYLPKTGLSNLNQLASQSYGSDALFHRYFVDGPLLEADAYIKPRGSVTAGWTNMLVGTMGAGGKAVFALTVPLADPSNMSANNVQWELSGDSDLGHGTGNVRVGKVQGSGGGWYAFVPNGVHSASGAAVLLMVNMETGAIAGRVQMPGAAGSNGLMGIRLLRNAKQEVYAAYAGDLQGNLWRIDFEGPSPTQWKVGLKGKPLFRAASSTNVAQPITAPPAVMLHPLGGHLVLFGTGRLIDLTDAGNTNVQSFYGVWDTTPVETSSVALDSNYAEHETLGTAYRSKMVQQTISTSAVQAAFSQLYYLVSSNPVNWSTKKGWYLDMTVASGQRVTFGAQTLLGWVYFTSIVPAGQAAACEISQSGAYSFMLDALTGGASKTPQFDLNGDGVVDDKDATDVNGDGAADNINFANQGIGGYQTSADGVDKLLGERFGLVNDEDRALTTSADATENAAKCVGSSKCGAGYCLVVVVNTSNQAEEMCVKPQCEDLNGDGVADNPCCANPASCAGPKKVFDRIWKRLVTPPV